MSNTEAKIERLVYNAKEAGELLSVSRSTLVRLVQSGDLSAFRTTDTDKGQLRFTRRALDEYVAHMEATRAA